MSEKVQATFWIIVLLSFVGILDSGYLTISHLSNTEVICSIVEGCDVVLSSIYSEVFGVPLAGFGLLFYLSLFFGGLYVLGSKNMAFAKKLLVLPLIGLGVSLYLVYLQLFVLNAICQYCMISATLSLLLFILGAYVCKKIEI